MAVVRIKIAKCHALRIYLGLVKHLSDFSPFTLINYYNDYYLIIN